MCLTPFRMKHKYTGEYNTFPCGKCPECIGRRVSGWSFRLRMEERRSSSAHFVTLTYNTNHVPITKNRFMSLCKADLQKFFKRLRYLLPEANIKYYACGEYGGQFGRPHYHAIIFNADPTSIMQAWSLDNKSFGNCFFGTVTGASIGYTLKYMSKESKIPLHRNDDRVKEFAIMSKRLGDNYIDDKTKAWHKADLLNRMYLNIDGKKISMPRYYKDKIYTRNTIVLNENGHETVTEVGERERIAAHAKVVNAKREEEFEEEMLKKYGEDWYRMKVEGDMAQFRKMYKDALKNRTKV